MALPSVAIETHKDDTQQAKTITLKTEIKLKQNWRTVSSKLL